MQPPMFSAELCLLQTLGIPAFCYYMQLRLLVCTAKMHHVMGVTFKPNKRIIHSLYIRMGYSLLGSTTC